MFMKIFSKKVLVIFLLFASIGAYSFTFLDEGMFPLSDLNRVDLKKAGLEISQTDIFNPGQVGLVDALVQVGGCTGSFISDEGLIITNHHCAFGAVRLASTPENDYLTNGFVAREKGMEIKAQGLTIRITDSYEDVSSRVLQAAQSSTDPAERIQLITQERLNIAKEAEQKDPSIKAEVSEMFIGKSYVLFRYKTIEDVRLVYVPQQIIGEFGGDTDNWVWPRHTGDFSFLRAYVAPDGSPAAYSADNVPYKPKKFLKVNPNGVKEEDFAFILGYPGRTFRHRPAQYIEYQERFLLPYTAALYDFQNNEMVKAGNNDRAIELSLATRIKSNANVMKNYRGKMKGLKAIDLHKNKQDEDLALAQFIENDPQLKARYGSLMTDIDNLYKDIFSDAERELWFNQIYASTRLLNVARQLNTFKLAVENSANKEEIFHNNLLHLKDILSSIYESYNFSADSAIFIKMLTDASEFSNSQLVTAVNKRPNIINFAKKSLSESKLKDKDFVLNELLSSPESLFDYTDNLLL